MSFNVFPSGGGGGNSVAGPVSSTNKAVARWNGVAGNTLQNSLLVIDDSGNASGLGTVSSGELTSSSLSASTALVSGASKQVQSSSTTATELGYVSGVTSAIQTQVNGLAKLVGRAGGQTLDGDTASGGNLTLSSTANATKGKIIFGTSAYDEVNNRLGIGTASPNTALEVSGTIRVDVNDFDYILRVNGAGSGVVNNGSNYWLWYHSGAEYFSLSDQTSSAQLQATNNRDLMLGVNGSVSTQKTVIKQAGGQTVGDTLQFQDSSSVGWASFTVGKQVGIGTTTPATSALVDLTSTTGALLLPRMTSTQRDALTPVNGMIIYNTSTDKFQGYENGGWANFSAL